jgi:replicative superfamily II helicase
MIKLLILFRYPLARAKNRKIIFHAGPTNSGKTYHALERFITAKSGVYCAPLKLLVAEVFHKCNERVNIIYLLQVNLPLVVIDNIYLL